MMFGMERSLVRDLVLEAFFIWMRIEPDPHEDFYINIGDACFDEIEL